MPEIKKRILQLGFQDTIIPELLKRETDAARKNILAARKKVCDELKSCARQHGDQAAAHYEKNAQVFNFHCDAAKQYEELHAYLVHETMKFMFDHNPRVMKEMAAETTVKNAIQRAQDQ